MSGSNDTQPHERARDESMAGTSRAFAKSTSKPDDALAGMKARAKDLRRFEEWLRGQYPGVEHPPGKDELRADVFAYGLSHYIEAFPPVVPLADRMAEFKAKASA